MSSPIEILNEKIDTDKEILSVMPKNTKKNTEAYIKKVEEIKGEYQRYLNDIILEVKRRANKINSIKENPEIKEVEEDLEKFGELDLLGVGNTAYEKMKLDELLFILRRFYKNNLEQVNNNILSCIRRFNEVGVELKPDDFNYSPFARRYMKVFFQEYKKGDVNSQKMKDTFEQLYWECSDIIVHIELNIRYLYLKNEKEIEKHFASENKMILKDLETSDREYLEKYRTLKAKLDDLTGPDKRIILDKFLNKELDVKDYDDIAVEKQLQKILAEPYETYSKTDLNEIKENVVKLSKTLEEYKSYLKYKYVLDALLKIYNEKDKYKNGYEKQKKEIQKLEKKLVKTNRKYERTDKLKDMLFFKNNSSEKLKQLTMDINNQILAIKDLYRKIDNDKVNDKIATMLTDNSTIYDALFLAGSFYTFLVEAIINEIPDIPEKEINETVADIRKFITSPYITIINNVTIKEEKDMALMIKDKYNLFNINITKTDLDESSIGALVNTVDSIVNAYNLENSGLNLDDIKYILKANKILEDLKDEEK